MCSKDAGQRPNFGRNSGFYLNHFYIISKQRVIPSSLYQTRRNKPLVYKGFYYENKASISKLIPTKAHPENSPASQVPPVVHAEEVIAAVPL